jgi:hypothetical protein
MTALDIQTDYRLVIGAPPLVADHISSPLGRAAISRGVARPVGVSTKAAV